MSQSRSKLSPILAVACVIGAVIYWRGWLAHSDDGDAHLDASQSGVSLSALPVDEKRPLPASGESVAEQPQPIVASPSSGDAAATSIGVTKASSGQTASELGFHPVDGWPGWLCHDAGDDESDWYAIGKGASTTERYSGSCASWSHTAPVETHEFARVPPLPSSEPCSVTTSSVGSETAESPVSAIDCHPSERDSMATGRDERAGLSDWWCSDVEGDHPQSLWFRIVDGPAASMVLGGSCAAWARGDVPEEHGDAKD